jgi:uncharacterized membrane protein YkvA (DUF1232 family)
MDRIKRLTSQGKSLWVDIYALYLACRDPRTPWYAKLLLAGVVALVVSPIDPIPDFIPVIGILDDIVIARLGTTLAIRMIPKQVMAECREKARNAMGPGLPEPSRWRSRCMIAAIVVAIGCLIAALVGLLVLILVILLIVKLAGN